jgi:hypothetical protein
MFQKMYGLRKVKLDIKWPGWLEKYLSGGLDVA